MMSGVEELEVDGGEEGMVALSSGTVENSPGSRCFSGDALVAVGPPRTVFRFRWANQRKGDLNCI